MDVGTTLNQGLQGSREAGMAGKVPWSAGGRPKMGPLELRALLITVLG